jgi:hypothetical protein
MENIQWLANTGLDRKLLVYIEIQYVSCDATDTY